MAVEWQYGDGATVAMQRPWHWSRTQRAFSGVPLQWRPSPIGPITVINASFSSISIDKALQTMFFMFL